LRRAQWAAEDKAAEEGQKPVVEEKESPQRRGGLDGAFMLDSLTFGKDKE
jgi:hypothetical protein